MAKVSHNFIHRISIRANEVPEVFKVLLPVALMLLVWMSTMRFLLFLTVFSSHIQNKQDVLFAFFQGFRFDLLVIGFLTIPLWAGLWFSMLLISVKKYLLIWKIYVTVAVLFIFDFYWMDFFWSQVHLERLSSKIFSSNIRQVIDQGWNQVGSIESWFLTIGMGMTALALVILVHSRKFNKSIESRSWKLLVLHFLGSLLIVGFAARGTITPHHLNIEHSQISEDPLVNQLPLNPIWNIDK